MLLLIPFFCFTFIPYQVLSSAFFPSHQLLPATISPAAAPVPRFDPLSLSPHVFCSRFSLLLSDSSSCLSCLMVERLTHSSVLFRWRSDFCIHSDRHLMIENMMLLLLVNSSGERGVRYSPANDMQNMIPVYSDSLLQFTCYRLIILLHHPCQFHRSDDASVWFVSPGRKDVYY